MKDLLLYIARNLVDNPDAVSVTEIQGEQELTLELRVAPDDMGKVIGRQGRIAKELRTVIRSYAQRTGVKVSVDIVEVGSCLHLLKFGFEEYAALHRLMVGGAVGVCGDLDRVIPQSVAHSERSVLVDLVDAVDDVLAYRAVQPSVVAALVVHL